ncbi:MAG: hypothetical protein ACRD2A_12550, partial [Vicinamibacterales bacterium]
MPFCNKSEARFELHDYIDHFYNQNRPSLLDRRRLTGSLRAALACRERHRRCRVNECRGKPAPHSHSALRQRSVEYHDTRAGPPSYFL